MYESLVEGKRYKVRLKPLEELMKAFPESTLFIDDNDLWDVEAEHHTTNSQGVGLCRWFSKYLDGGLGYFTFDGNVERSGVWVKWEVDDDTWYYEWGMLKVLGEV